MSIERPVKLQDKFGAFDSWMYKFWKYITTLALGDLSNVDLTGLASGDVLYYNGTEWVPLPLQEAVEDYVGTMVDDTATVAFTYTDLTGSLTADVVNNSITYAKFQQLASQVLVGRYSAGTGNAESIVIGTGLTLTTDGTLSASAAGVTGTATKLWGVYGTGTTKQDISVGAGLTLTTAGDLKIGGTATDTTAFTAMGDVTFSGSGRRVQGDFSDSTVTNRTWFQNSVSNQFSIFGAIPNGTATEAALMALNNSGVTNAQWIVMGCNTNNSYVQSHGFGTSTSSPKPMYVYTGTNLQANFFTDGVKYFYNNSGVNHSLIDPVGRFYGRAPDNAAYGYAMQNSDARMAAWYWDNVGSYYTGIDGTPCYFTPTFSDPRLKTAMRPISQRAIDVIKQITPIEFYWDRTNPLFKDATEKQIGFRSDNIKLVLPEAVPPHATTRKVTRPVQSTKKDKDGRVVPDGPPRFEEVEEAIPGIQYDQVDLRPLVAYLVKAVQELSGELDILKAK
jgi:hypothetical protein